MPSMQGFGRRWNVASDDFVFIEITEAFLRILWVAITGMILLSHNLLQCPSHKWLICVLILVIINVCSGILCCLIAVNSARGSILETSARKHVTTLIYIRIPFIIAEIIWTIVSTGYVFQVFGVGDFCYFIHGIRFAVVFEWLSISMIFIRFLMFFNPNGRRRHDSVMFEKNYWKTRLCLCKLGQDSEFQKAIDNIAGLLASFLIGHDFVFSDIVAGLLLIAHSPHDVKNKGNILVRRPPMPDWMKLPENLTFVQRYLEFAYAIYGWPSYIYNNFGCRPFYRLISKLQCCYSCQRDRTLIIEDDCCFCHTSAFILQTQLKEGDLFYVSFKNRLYQTPFVVLADHQTKSVVITIRGTASLFDFVTVLSVNNERFSVNVDSDPILQKDKTLDDDEVRVHRGMLNGARHVYNTMKANNVLDDIFMLNPGYTLVVCGHSLGAGIASLLTLLLKQQYPDIRCYAFSPPGCVISKHGLQEMENHVLSIIVGDDLVPRATYQSMCRLKNKVDRELHGTKRAKYEILIKGIFKLFFTVPWKLHDTESNAPETRDYRRLIDEDSPSNYVVSHQTEDYPVIKDNQENDVFVDSFKMQLFPPGRLVHFNTVNNTIELRWIEPDYLSDIELTDAIFIDHFPSTLRKVLKKAVNDYSLVLTNATTNETQQY